MIVLHTLVQPHPLEVESGDDDQPVAIVWRGRRRLVTAIADHWRIEDEWWRQPLARDYYLIELDGCGFLTVFHDRMTGAWYAQPYRPPVAEGVTL